jgi:hypothetical protein
MLMAPVAKRRPCSGMPPPASGGGRGCVFGAGGPHLGFADNPASGHALGLTEVALGSNILGRQGNNISLVIGLRSDERIDPVGQLRMLFSDVREPP